MDDILGSLSDILSAPRRAVWSALGGPESGAELVSNWTGLDKEGTLAKALGAGAEMIGDPLTYALPLGAGLLTKGLRGTSAAAKALDAANAGKNIGMTGEELYRFAPKAGRFLADESGSMNVDALGNLLRPGYSQIKDLQKGFTTLKKVGATSPDVAEEIAALAASGQKVPRGYAMVSAAGKDAADPIAYAAKVVNRGEGVQSASGELARSLRTSMGPEYRSVPSQMYGQGEYIPELKQALISQTSEVPGETLRHEVGGHGLSHMAAIQDKISALPLAQRPGAWLMQPRYKAIEDFAKGLNPAATSDARYALGSVLDEAYSHAIQNRGLGKQVKGWADFMLQRPSEALGLNPAATAYRRGYSDVYSSISPLVGQLYEGLGLLPYAAGALGTGLGAGAALSKIRPTQEQP